jgi:hypothetical protein
MLLGAGLVDGREEREDRQQSHGDNEEAHAPERRPGEWAVRIGRARKSLGALSQTRTIQNATATYWHATATSVSAWKSSWYPKIAGTGSGRRRA